jgi:hypothetical protein
MGLAQFTKPLGMHFTEPEFIAIIVTAFASVIALWAIVGKGVFGSK